MLRDILVVLTITLCYMNKPLQVFLTIIGLGVVISSFSYAPLYKGKSVSLNDLLASPTSPSKAASTYDTPCTCPYRILAVGGTGSTHDPNDPTKPDPISKAFFDFIYQVTGDSISIPLHDNGQGESANTAANYVEQQIKAELEKKPKRKVLVIAYSLGAIVSHNVMNRLSSAEKLCVDILPIDPPTKHPSCKNLPVFIQRLIPACKQINDANNGQNPIGGDPDLIDWTGGTANPSSDHDPFSDQTTRANKKKLEELKKKIKEKINSCSD